MIRHLLAKLAAHNQKAIRNVKIHLIPSSLVSPKRVVVCRGRFGEKFESSKNVQTLISYLKADNKPQKSNKYHNEIDKIAVRLGARVGKL